MEKTDFEFAGFWKRFAATTIDDTLIIFTCMTLKWALVEVLQVQAGLDFGTSQELAYLIWINYMVLVRWCYFAGMESSPLKATIGKIAVGIYVTDENGDRIDFGKASGRFFGKILSGLILGVGYMMAGFTEKKQALHDRMSHCLVLEK